MMKTLLLIGLLIAPSAHAQTETLYNQVKALVEQESQSNEAELLLQRYALGLYYDRVQIITDESGPEPVSTPFEIEEETYADIALQSDYTELCGKQEDKKITYGVCHEAMEQIRQSIERNTRHRQLGRELQMIAAGYHAGIDGYLLKLSSITHLWRASSDPLIDPFVEFLTRARTYPAAKARDIEAKAKEIVTALSDMLYEWKEGETEKEDDTKLRAMLHRYRHGVRSVIAAEGACEDAEEPEQYWLYARDCPLEDLLEELSELLQEDEFEEGFTEQIMYPSYIDEEENISIWMRYDDVGLEPVQLLEPVQTTLVKDDFLQCIDAGGSYRDCYEADPSQLVRGGRYPSTVPEPLPRQGICSHPFGKRGYLCRDIEQEACDLTQEQQRQLTANGTGGIILTGCQPQDFAHEVARTVSGPNICGIGGWREEVPGNIEEDTPFEDRYMEVPPCSACAVDVICSEGDCPGGTTAIKRDGIVEICIPNEEAYPGDSMMTMVREFVRARQSCAESTLQTQERTAGAAGCCSANQEVHFAECKIYATLGVLEPLDVTIEECAGALSNSSCGNVCTNSNQNPVEMQRQIDAMRVSMAQAGNLNLPTTCAQAMEDPRILALRNSMPLSCKPGCQAKYQNTIGNNLCFTGQCLEETHEWSRDVPGRMGLTTLDQDFPWDACMRADPNLGNFDVPPALVAPKLPTYNPEQFVRELDEELCQINGLPLQTPPILCGYDAEISIDLERTEYGFIASDLRREPEEYDATSVGIEYAAQSMGARIANEMLLQYLTPAMRNFADILNTMHHIFARVGDLEFPDTMCSRYAPGTFSCNQYTE